MYIMCCTSAQRTENERTKPESARYTVPQWTVAPHSMFNASMYGCTGIVCMAIMIIEWTNRLRKLDFCSKDDLFAFVFPILDYKISTFYDWMLKKTSLLGTLFCVIMSGQLLYWNLNIFVRLCYITLKLNTVVVVVVFVARFVFHFRFFFQFWRRSWAHVLFDFVRMAISVSVTNDWLSISIFSFSKFGTQNFLTDCRVLLHFHALNLNEEIPWESIFAVECWLCFCNSINFPFHWLNNPNSIK